MNKMKHFVCLILAFVMILSVSPLQVLADVDIYEPGAPGEEDTLYHDGYVLGADEIGVQLLWMADGDSIGSISEDASSIFLAAYGGMSMKCMAKAILTNNSGSTAKLSFNYMASSYSSFTIQGQSIGNGDGEYAVVLEPEQTVMVTITGAEVSGGTANLTLDNFALTPIAASATVTVIYDPEMGGVTVGDSTDTDEDGRIVAQDVGSSGVELVAVAADGFNFDGWVEDSTGELLASEAEYTHIPTGDVTIRAVFSAPRQPATFKVNKTVYDNLNDAIDAAAKSTYYKTVTLASSGVLPAGEYNIPAGVKLLIPFDQSDDGTFGDEPETSTTKYTLARSAFRTLIMENGAVLNCAGQINVNGRVMKDNGSYTGACTGDYGCINLEKGSAINLITDSNGRKGELYCYGYIIGEGTVIAKSGTKVYEVFQMNGWRGGSVTLAWQGNENIKSFAFNDYAVQNIESAFVIESGAIAGVSATISGTGNVPFLGEITLSKSVPTTYIGTIKDETGFIRLGEGASVTRTYHPDTHRTEFIFDGECQVEGINLSITVGKEYNLNTASYILAIPFGFDFVANEGSKVTLNNSFKLLPGATLTAKKNSEVIVNGQLYIYDTADYRGKGPATSPVAYVASTGTMAASLPKINAKTPSGLVTVDGTLTINGAVYTTENGGTSVNKVLQGNGKIVNNSNATLPVTDVLDEFNNSLTDYNIRVVPVVGQIAGASIGNEYHSFANEGAIYYGTGDGYWYQHAVSVDTFENIRNIKNLSETVTAGVNRTRTVVQTDSETKQDVTTNNVIGFISDYLEIDEAVNEESGEVSYTASVITTPFTFTVPTRTEVTADNGTIDKTASLYKLYIESGNAKLTVEPTVAGENELLLEYDDHFDISAYGEDVEIIDGGDPTSFKVGHGITDKVQDDAVIAIEGNYLVATGVGEAKVRLGDKEYTVDVVAAPISMLFLGGQSNMQGSRGNGKQSIVCPEGMVYGTYGDRYGMKSAADALKYAPSALTGPNSLINTVGTTQKLSDYPVMMHNAGVKTTTSNNAGKGKNGPDSGFAYQWVESTGEKVWVINAAHGGSPLSDWIKGGSEYNEAVALFNACQKTMQKEIAAGHYTLSHMGFYWCQGESDSTKTAEYYAENFLSMYEDLKVDLSMDMDSNVNTPDQTIEFTNIVLTFAGSLSNTGYRYDAEEGLYVAGDNAGWRTHEELEMRGQRVAQLWLGANPAYPDINVVCNIADGWYDMPENAELPNGTLSVADYFQKHYPNGVIDYQTQEVQNQSWKTPDSPSDVRCTATDGAGRLHYNQLGFNEIGREAVRNTMYLLGYEQDPAEVETEVKFYDWTGYREVESIGASVQVQSSTLVVPVVSPIYRAKDVTYQTSDGLDYVYYDLTADAKATNGTLNAIGANIASVNVEGRALGEYRWDFDGSEFESTGVVENTPHYKSGSVQNGKFNNILYTLDDPVVLRQDESWLVEIKMVNTWEKGVTKILANNSGARKAGDVAISAHSTGLYFSYVYEDGGSHTNMGIASTMTAGDTTPHVFRLFNKVNAATGKNQIYYSIDGGTPAAMNEYVNGQSYIISSIGNSEYPLTGGSIEYIYIKETGATQEMHIHQWGEWEQVSDPTYLVPGEKIRKCACGETESAEVPFVPYTSYRWDLRDGELVSTGTMKNELTQTAGSINLETGIFTNVIYSMQTPIQLKQTEEWSVEFEMIDTWTGDKIIKFIGNNPAGPSNGDACIGLGASSITICTYSGGHINNTASSGLTRRADSDPHKLVVYNEVDEETQTNQLWLRVDDSEPVAFAAGANGRDFTFGYIGNSGYPLTGGSIRYIEVKESGVDCEHSYDNGVVTKEPSCAEEGVTTFTCTICGTTYTESIAKLDHTYGDTAEWIWTGSDKTGYTAATANFACECGEKYTVEAEVSEEVTLEPTETTEGTKVYTATAVYNEATYTDTKTVTIPAFGEPLTYKKYRWELNSDKNELVSVKIDGYTENELINKVGTITNGVTNNLQYQFTTPIVLDHTKSWTIEWNMTQGTNTSWQKILSGQLKALSGTENCLMVTGTNKIALSLYTTASSHNNYSSNAMTASDFNLGDQHTYKLENRVNADNTNTIYLWVDNNVIGTFDTHDTPNKSAWLPGADLTFKYIGQQGSGTKYYGLTGATINYIEVQMEHTHTWAETPEWTWSGDDTNGYTTATAAFTCECGATENVDAEVTSEITLEPTETTEGTKIYTATVIVDEKTYTDTKTVVIPALGEAIIYKKYRWELNEDKNELVSVKTEGYTENELINKVGTITNGVTNNLQYQFTTPIVLDHTKSWTVEWNMTQGANTSWQKILSGQLKALSGTENCLMVTSTNKIALSLYTTSNSHNNYSSSAMTASDFNLGDQHTYKLENRVNADNTNTIYLWVDNNVIGTFDTHDTPKKSAWLPGADLTFKYIGQQKNSSGTNYYGLTGATINYIEVQMEHTHTWDETPAWTWSGDETNGYTSATAEFTCECGAAESVEAEITSEVTLEPTETTEGTKVYTAMITFNEKTYTDAKAVQIPIIVPQYTKYRWELNTDKSELVSVKTDGYTENELINKVGTITDGVTNNLQYKFTSPVVLERTKQWSIEWYMSGSNPTADNAWQKILAGQKKALSGTENCLMVLGAKTISLSKYFSSTHHNYSASKMSDSTIDMRTENHKYRLENIWHEDNANIIYLYIDDNLIGPIDTLGAGKTHWNNDATITFNYIGQQGSGTKYYGLTGATINYIEVQLDGNHEHSYVKGICSVCGKEDENYVPVTIDHYGQNLRLQDLIKIGYYFTVQSEEDVQEVGALLWTAEDYTAETNLNIDSTLATKYGSLSDLGGYYLVETKGIYAQELDDTFYLIPYVKYSDAEGEHYSYGEAKEYSALHYIEKAYNSDAVSKDLKSLVVDLANYGTAAREYFCITENLSVPEETFNSCLPETERVDKWTESMKAVHPTVDEKGDLDPQYYGKNINLLEAINLGIYYANTSVTGAVYWNQSGYDSNAEHTVATKTGDAILVTETSGGSSYIKAKVNGLYAYNIYDNYYVRCYDASQQLSDTIGMSVAAYLSELIDMYTAEDLSEKDKALVALCKAMQVYGTNAKSNPEINRAN